MERRQFLVLTGAGVAWACAGPAETPDATPSTGEVTLALTARRLAIGDTRLAMAVLRDGKPVVPDSLDVRLGPSGGEPVSVEAVATKISRGTGGDAPDTSVEDIFVVRHGFDTPGIWTVAITADGARAQAPLQVVEEAAEPLVGDEAVSVDSPTVDDARGVDPICTRDPMCAMHDLTIAEALDAGRPLVVTFATPRFCTTRTCGPVVDVVLEAREQVGDEVNFVHIEVWADDEDAVNDPAGTSPAFAAWRLDTEPWTYFIDADGVVADRWLGAVGADEVARAAADLTAGGA